MNSVLQLIMEGESLTTAQMAEVLKISHEEVEKQLAQLKEQGKVLGWRPILNPDMDENSVRAVIEVKISPEREGGFDRLAQRISQFEQVENCYLMSGGYDLLLFVRAQNLRKVAAFVYERLATIGGVVSTSTHFILRPYKEQGFLLSGQQGNPDKPMISA